MAENRSSGSSSPGDVGSAGTKSSGGTDPVLLDPDQDIWRVSGFRVALPQVLATLAQCVLLLALGMMVGVPTLVVGALLNAPSGMSMDASQASWFAGIILAVQPLGSVLSGFLSDGLGRKSCMMFVALPQLAGWILMYNSQNLLMLDLSALLLGFSIGFMEAPCLSYVGEVSQPHLRARMCTMSSLCVPVGYLVMYLLGTVMDWRSCAIYSVVMPILTVLVISQVPESPQWLLRKGRVADAEAALCWLRGWVTPAEVRKELGAMQAYVDKSQHQGHQQTRSPGKGQIYIEVPSNGNGPRLAEGPSSPRAQLTFKEKLKDLTRPELMRPMRLVVTYFFFYHCGAMTGLRPYMVKVFLQFKLTTDPYWLTVSSALLQIAGAIVCISIIHRLGKRVITFISLGACSFSLLALGGYALVAQRGYNQPLVPMVLFAALFFFTNIGIAAVPWALISEVFPPRGRGVGGGVSSALYYIMYFLTSKTYLDLLGLLGLHGVFLLYGCLGAVGLVVLYRCLPETEGRRLEDIEQFFQDKTDRSLPIN